MPNYEIKEITDKREWEGFLLPRKPGTFLQSWNWGEVNKRVGLKIKRMGVYEKNRLVGLFLLIHQPAKRGPHFLIPGGPVIDYENENLYKFVVNSIKKIAQDYRVWFVRIRPDVADSEQLKNRLRKLGFISAPMHLHGEHTLVLDIGESEEEILKGMRKTTRYLIKKSLTEGYTIKISDNPDDAKVLYRLQEETIRRHRFVGFSEELFKAQLEVFGKEDQAKLFICERNGEQLVSALIIFYGEKAFYHHSASSDSARNTNASYFTQWQIIKYLKSKGIHYYDFWGIAPNDNPKHRFFGVSVFKKGFGGQRVDWLHAHDLIISPLYWATFIFETARRIYRGL